MQTIILEIPEYWDEWLDCVNVGRAEVIRKYITSSELETILGGAPTEEAMSELEVKAFNLAKRILYSR